jgi:hypothetical protein
MYTSISVQVAEARQRDLMAAAARERRARQALQLASASQPPASRRSRRPWHLARLLRPQVQQ